MESMRDMEDSDLQLGVAAVHRGLEPKIDYFMKISCSREIYRHDPYTDNSLSTCFLHKKNSYLEKLVTVWQVCHDGDGF